MIETSYCVGSPSLRLSDVMLLWGSGGFDSADGKAMVSKAKRNFVNSRHRLKIFQMHSANKYKDGNWKTYIYADGKRKEVIRKTEEELYATLFDFYSALEDKPKTFAEAVELFMQRKENELNRSNNTTLDYRRYYAYVSDGIQHKALNDITEPDLRSWLQNEYMPTKPIESALRKMLQHLKALFRYGMSQKLCTSNPAEYIEVEDYLKDCNLNKKQDEQRAFSDAELSLIQADAIKTPTDSRALMTLMAKETGMRAGELPVLHKNDIQDGFIHVHRQQIRSRKNGYQEFYEVPYTKDERKHPHAGRYVPITDSVAEILELAERLPGCSEYIFHDKKGMPISKDSYEQNLRRRCQRLGIETTNNHAFRLALNSKYIEMGLSSADRALILGHTVETNERNYSVSDNRRRYEIRNRICKEMNNEKSGS